MTKRMILIADSSALLALAACDSLVVLELLFQEVYVPSAVYSEVTVEGKAFAEMLRSFLEGRMVTIDASRVIITDFALGAGEIEAMALYKQQNADVLLVDDRRARAVARANDIRVIGSLGVLLAAKEQGHIAAVLPRLAAIDKAGIYISSSLWEQTRRLAREE
jgi:uncharacterized protein